MQSDNPSIQRKNFIFIQKYNARVNRKEIENEYHGKWPSTTVPFRNKINIWEAVVVISASIHPVKNYICIHEYKWQSNSGSTERPGKLKTNA